MPFHELNLTLVRILCVYVRFVLFVLLILASQFKDAFLFKSLQFLLLSWQFYHWELFVSTLFLFIHLLSSSFKLIDAPLLQLSITLPVFFLDLQSTAFLKDSPNIKLPSRHFLCCGANFHDMHWQFLLYASTLISLQLKVFQFVLVLLNS